MRHASLFSGIGGFNLSAEWMGWTNVFNCEIDKFCQRVLKYHFPDATQYQDIKQTDFTIWNGRVDILTGGFPCQPFSQAGKRKGTDDDRHLWPEMLRAIHEIQPRWVVGENVHGFITWSGGLVFRQVLSDLENEGYEVQPFIIPACGVNAPHRRDRVWIVAHATSAGSRNRMRSESEWEEEIQRIRRKPRSEFGKGRQDGPASDTEGERMEGDRADREQEPQTQIEEGLSGRNHTRTDWTDFPTVSPLCKRDDGVSFGLVDITFSRWRNESIKALGNAIVPPVVYEIFKTIDEYERIHGNKTE